MKFQVNQKVIALNDARNSLSQQRIKGTIYTVTALSWCPDCGTNSININNTPSHNPTIICPCGNKRPKWRYWLV